MASSCDPTAKSFSFKSALGFLELGHLKNMPRSRNLSALMQEQAETPPSRRSEVPPSESGELTESSFLSSTNLSTFESGGDPRASWLSSDESVTESCSFSDLSPSIGMTESAVRSYQSLQEELKRRKEGDRDAMHEELSSQFKKLLEDKFEEPLEKKALREKIKELLSTSHLAKQSMDGIKELLEAIKRTAAGEVSEWLAQFWLLLTEVDSPMALATLLQESRLDQSMRSLISEAIGGEEVCALLCTYFQDMSGIAIDKLVALFTQLSSTIVIKYNSNITSAQQVVVDKCKMLFQAFFLGRTWTTDVAPWESLPDATQSSCFSVYPAEVKPKQVVAKLFLSAVLQEPANDGSAIVRFQVTDFVFYPAAAKHQRNAIQEVIERGFKQFHVIQRASRRIRSLRQSGSPLVSPI